MDRARAAKRAKLPRFLSEFFNSDLDRPLAVICSQSKCKKQEAHLTHALVNWIPALANVPQLVIEGAIIILVTIAIWLLTRWGEYLLAALSGVLYLIPLLRYMMH
jgi:uncharacterized membrane protein (DUF2068 family)